MVQRAGASLDEIAATLSSPRRPVAGPVTSWRIDVAN